MHKRGWNCGRAAVEPQRKLHALTARSVYLRHCNADTRGLHVLAAPVRSRYEREPPLETEREAPCGGGLTCCLLRPQSVVAGASNHSQPIWTYRVVSLTLVIWFGSPDIIRLETNWSVMLDGNSRRVIGWALDRTP